MAVAAAVTEFVTGALLDNPLPPALIAGEAEPAVRQDV
jgi:hypothetical protein